MMSPMYTLHPALAACLTAVGSGVFAISIDYLRFSRYRQGFAHGTLIGVIAALAVIYYHFCVEPLSFHSPRAMIVICVALCASCFGQRLIAQANIADQEAGQMSKLGSWSQSFDDNYIFNKIENGLVLPLLICLTIGGIVFYGQKAMQKNAVQPGYIVQVPSQTVKAQTHVVSSKKKRHGKTKPQPKTGLKKLSQASTKS